MLQSRFVEVSKNMTSEELEIIQEALEEFLGSDRWDEFSLETTTFLVTQLNMLMTEGIK